MAAYTIDRTQPTTYLDNANNPVEGYLVTVTLTQWNEGHQFAVPSLDTDVIAARVMTLIEQRAALDELAASS